MWLTWLHLMGSIIWNVWKNLISTQNPQTQKSPFASVIAMQVIYFIWRKMKNNGQISIEELKDQIKAGKYSYYPSAKTVKSFLINKLKEDIVISTTGNNVPVICFTNIWHCIFTGVWYQQQCSSSFEERLHIVQFAMKILGLKFTNLLNILLQRRLEGEFVSFCRNHEDFHINSIFNKRKGDLVKC